MKSEVKQIGGDVWQICHGCEAMRYVAIWVNRWDCQDYDQEAMAKFEREHSVCVEAEMVM